jgi:hypothetical protein
MGDPQMWEYYVETVGSALRGTRDEELQQVLNELGEDGWDVIEIEQLPNSNKIRVVAKRPLTISARRERSRPA